MFCSLKNGAGESHGLGVMLYLISIGTFIRSKNPLVVFKNSMKRLNLKDHVIKYSNF